MGQACAGLTRRTTFFEAASEVKECRPDTRLVGGSRVGSLEEDTVNGAEPTGAASPSAFVG